MNHIFSSPAALLPLITSSVCWQRRWRGMVGTLRYVDREVRDIYVHSLIFLALIYYCLCYYFLYRPRTLMSQQQILMTCWRTWRWDVINYGNAEAKFSFVVVWRAYYYSCILVQDMDDMDADLFASKKKPSSAPAQTKPYGNEGPRKDASTLESKVKPEGAGNSVRSVRA